MNKKPININIILVMQSEKKMSFLKSQFSNIYKYVLQVVLYDLKYLGFELKDRKINKAIKYCKDMLKHK